MGSPRTNHHPYSRYLAAAFAFLFDQNGRLLLLSEQDAERKYMCDLPGGTLTDQEPPVAGLHREVLEETGLHIELLSPLCWLKWDMHDSGCPILVAFYIAETHDSDVSLSLEHRSFRWVTIEEFMREVLEVSAEPQIVRDCFDRYRELKKQLGPRTSGPMHQASWHRSTHTLFRAPACGMILAGRRTVAAVAARNVFRSRHVFRRSYIGSANTSSSS